VPAREQGHEHQLDDLVLPDDAHGDGVRGACGSRLAATLEELDVVRASGSRTSTADMAGCGLSHAGRALSKSARRDRRASRTPPLPVHADAVIAESPPRLGPAYAHRSVGPEPGLARGPWEAPRWAFELTPAGVMVGGLAWLAVYAAHAPDPLMSAGLERALRAPSVACSSPCSSASPCTAATPSTPASARWATSSRASTGGPSARRAPGLRQLPHALAEVGVLPGEAEYPRRRARRQPPHLSQRLRAHGHARQGGRGLQVTGPLRDATASRRAHGAHRRRRARDRRHRRGRAHRPGVARASRAGLVWAGSGRPRSSARCSSSVSHRRCRSAIIGLIERCRAPSGASVPSCTRRTTACHAAPEARQPGRCRRCSPSAPGRSSARRSGSSCGASAGRRACGLCDVLLRDEHARGRPRSGAGRARRDRDERCRGSCTSSGTWGRRRRRRR
jgi:hypothetical protein